MTWWWFTVALAGQVDDLSVHLEQTLDEAREEARWRSPYAAERSAVREATGLIAAGAPTCDEERLGAAAELLGAADLSLEIVSQGEVRVVLVREVHEIRGAGLFAVRCGPAQPLVWQAPHAWFDQQTGDIARALFLEGGARAVMWNTVHRYGAAPQELKSDPVHPADVTREHGSLFQAATLGMAVGDSSLRFAQLHGFARSSSSWEVIVSTGNPDAPPQDVAAGLEPVFGTVAAYGEDAEHLGGTVNVQGQALREWERSRFLHLELSPRVREGLAGDAEVRARFAQVVADAEW